MDAAVVTGAALVSISMSASLETPGGVRVHALCPDGVDTDLVAAMRPDGAAKATVHSSGRLLTVAEVAEQAVALVGTRRVVRTLPAWRGGLIRLGALAPSMSGGAFRAAQVVGRRVIARP